MSNPDLWNTTEEPKIILDLKELSEDELALLKSQTGILDMDELKKHVEGVAGKAFKVSHNSHFRLVFLPLTERLVFFFSDLSIPLFDADHILEVSFFSFHHYHSYSTNN
jgi:hypothetical protein